MPKAYRILLTENIHPTAANSLRNAGFQVDILSYAPDENELCSSLKNYDFIGIRSKTKITGKVVKENPHLHGIGCFCIGTNQVDLAKANIFGMPTFNAPHSNTRSVAEMVIANMINLARQMGDKNSKSHQGIWDKSAAGSKEVRGKTLGIIGYGHIGSQVSVLAEAMGLTVLFYDVVKKLPLGNARAVHELEDLLSESDFVTLHVPELSSTKKMFGMKELSKMKKGSFLINASRGSVVVIEDLVTQISEEHIAGAAIDVFPSEPASNEERFVSPLQNLPNVILTPHIGGSTEEAQLAIGQEVSESIIKFLTIGTTSGAVNFPNVDLPRRENSSRIINVHRNEPGVLGKINSIISERGANIDGQYLATDEKVGYLVIDVHADHAKGLINDIRALPMSIKTRLA